MDPIHLLLVGCGLMGGRHLRGYAELERVRPGSLRLRAVCDPRREAAEALAGEAEVLLGRRPAVYASVDAALRAESDLRAADVATLNTTHPEVALPLLEAGLDLQIEKPLGVTVAAAREIAESARRLRRTVAVAENNRRDPMNRLLHHVLRSGMVGRPAYVLQAGIGQGRKVAVSPWRHDWSQGGLALDVGIHAAYMLEYLVGPVETVFARSRQVWSLRDWPGTGGEPGTVEVESDDLYGATLAFENGVVGTWLMHFGGAGAPLWQRLVGGSEGTVSGPPDRSGQPLRVQRGAEVLEGEALLAALPEFHLNEIETRLFGDRPAGYRLASEETDRKLIAAETADFLDAVGEGRAPEVPADLGLRSVALVMALLESAHGAAAVRMDDVLSGSERHFQDRVISGS